MKLEVNARKMLKMRIRVYIYENVIGDNIEKATHIANEYLGRFDDMTDKHPTNSSRYWANFYYTKFIQDCEVL